MHRCDYFIQQADQEVECRLCPHFCKIKAGHSGICHVRFNKEGILYSLNYERIVALHLDPIEKKPLYRFHSGSSIFSIGSVGCNMKCSFCQNWQISQAGKLTDYFDELPEYAPDYIVQQALSLRSQQNIGIAYTYNEPTVWFEFMRDCARKAHQNKLLNVMVSNGYINAEPLDELLLYIDAFNIDLKGYDEHFYQQLAKAKLSPVLETLKQISNKGKHLEIAYLVIPGMNDDTDQFEAITDWLQTELNPEIVLHLNRYFPTYKLKIDTTPIETLDRLANIARRKLKYVYIGNV